MKLIHMMSGPRNISTAIMYAFGNRGDTEILDEPFYGCYLRSHPELSHPGREEVLSVMCTDYDQVVSQLTISRTNKSYLFIKNMAHHLENRSWAFMEHMENILLIRSPRKIISSYIKVLPDPTINDIGIRTEFEIYKYLADRALPYTIIDSDRLLRNPAAQLENLCKALSIPFSARMLAWKAGPRAEDGVWARYWYGNVHRSTGFNPPDNAYRAIPGRLEGLLDEAEYYYFQLLKKAI